jgi:endonuclease/exonuclease/phosphatase family metal-dependent hydrolase
MNFVFGANIELQEGHYGNAVLSRYPITGHQNQFLPNIDNGEQRGVLDTEIRIPGTEAPLRLLATHLDHRDLDSERIASAKAINQLINQHPRRPAILAGDLNDGPESTTLAEIESKWTRANKTPLATIPVDQPTRQIDFIHFQPASRWKVVETTVLDEEVASDHRAIFTVLELTPEQVRVNRFPRTQQSSGR